MALKKGVFVEDTKTNGQSSTPETETGAGSPDINNTPIASEGVTTQENGRTANDRIRQLVEENNRLKNLLPATAEPKATQPLQGSDDEWKKKIELELSVPNFLKEKVQDMTSYWQANPRMSKLDVYKIFTPTDVLVKQAQEADAAAQNSYTGGTSNPAARVENMDVKTLTIEQLEANLKSRIAAGEKL
jgi:hypothetical protein